MKKTGDRGEQIAVEYLRSKGYAILERNWRGTKEFKSPEIDIIVSIDNTVVIVEVKTVSTTRFGQPQEWITNQKRRRLIDGARAYQAIRQLPDTSFRFDAVLVDISVQPPSISHIVNAFTLSDTL